MHDITLVAVDCVDPNRAARALAYSARRFPVRRVILVTHEFPDVTFAGNVRIVPKLDYHGYSQFVVAELCNLVESGHCLLQQWDGFVLNPERWDPAWLQLDYVGAPWPDVTLNNRVGNGGFSLRSKRFLEFFRGERITLGEDIHLCRENYDRVLAAGMKYATPEDAYRFSVENECLDFGPCRSMDEAFGFHALTTPYRRELVAGVSAGTIQ